jgi:hypothetical protein
LSTDTWNEEQIAAMRQAHEQAWTRARADRVAFEEAAYGADVVAAEPVGTKIAELRAFLLGAAYSGSPWAWEADQPHVMPSAGLNPVDIEPGAVEAVKPFVGAAAKELWARALTKG